jgi:hypothetical protein
MSLFKDFANGVEGISDVTWVVGRGGVSKSISYVDAAGSSTVFGRSSTSVVFKVLPDSPTVPMAEGVSSIALNWVKGVDVMRNLSSRSLEGERERERFGDGGGFLKSIRGISLKDTKIGTDWALPFSVGITEEKADEDGLTLEAGFLVDVAERFLVERFPTRTSESERLRACPAAERWWRTSASLVLSLSLSSVSKFRFTLLGFL